MTAALALFMTPDGIPAVEGRKGQVAAYLRAAFSYRRAADYATAADVLAAAVVADRELVRIGLSHAEAVGSVARFPTGTRPARYGFAHVGSLIHLECFPDGWRLMSAERVLWPAGTSSDPHFQLSDAAALRAEQIAAERMAAVRYARTGDRDD